MANVFGILTAIVLALASFVAYKNKDAYANELNHCKEKDRILAATKVRLKLAQDNLATTHKNRTDTEVVVAKLKSEEADRKKSNEVLDQDIKSKTVVRDANKAHLDDVREKTKAIGQIRDLKQKVISLRDDMNNLRTSIANNLTKLAGLTEESVQTVGRNDVLKSHTEMIARRESFFTKTQISSIYPNWGFVTLGAGHISGVVTGSTLEIVRDGKAVAKVLVTAVESNTASATIVPDSLAEGTVLMVGDQVVPSHKPGPKPQTPVKPATAPTRGAKPAAEPSLEPASGAAPEPDAKPDTKPAATPEATPEATPAATPEATPPAGSN